MSQKNKPTQCPKCNSNVTKTQHSVGCKDCGAFYHCDCSGVSGEKLESIRKKITKFTCGNCKQDSEPNTNADIIKRIDEIKTSIENKMESNKGDLERRMDCGFHNLETKVVQLIDNLRSEVNTEISNVKSDVAHCYSIVKEADKANDAKFNHLQYKNNILERRLNRSDIVISGLSCSIESIRENVIKIAKFVGVDINNADINHCCYLNQRKNFVIKFNSVQLRDTIMQKYYKTQPLLLNKVIGGTVESRIYLNDNLSPASSKLNFLCRKLLTAKKIKKFYLINMDRPKAKIIMLNGKSVFLDSQQCANLLDGCLDDASVNNP